MESKVPNDHCHLTIPQLVNAGFRVKDNCFLCKEEGTLCLVAFHPQFPVFQHNQSTTIVMKNYPNPSNVDASSLADRDAIPYIMPPFINYPTYLNNELVGNLANATHTTRIEPSAVLTMSHRSQVSYKKIKSSETCSSRPNLRELINIIVSTANSLSKPYAFRVDEDVFVSDRVGGFYFCSKGSKPEPVISARNMALLASEAKGQEASILSCYAQAVSVAANAACNLLACGVALDRCVVPFVVCCGTVVQFGAVMLIPISFPVAFSLSPQWNLCHRSDKERISSMVSAIVQHLLVMHKEITKPGITSGLRMDKTFQTGKFAALDVDAYFFKPVLIKWLDIVEEKVEDEDRKFLCIHEFTHVMNIFDRLGTGDSKLKRFVCFPVGWMGLPNVDYHEHFYNFVKNQIQPFLPANDDLLTSGHPILLFPKINFEADGWRETTELAIDEFLLSNSNEFIDTVAETLMLVSEIGIIHMDIRLENIFYRKVSADSRMEILLIDWDDALFKGDIIPELYYERMQDFPNKYPSDCPTATEMFHEYSVERLRELIEEEKEVRMREERMRVEREAKAVEEVCYDMLPY